MFEKFDWVGLICRIPTSTKVFPINRKKFLLSINLFKNWIKVKGSKKMPTIDCEIQGYATVVTEDLGNF